MLNKWPVAGLVAGVILFLWGGLTHMVFNIESYMKAIPNEEAVLAVLQANIKDPGIYLYPFEMDPAKMEARTRTTARGLITLTPPGTPFSMGQSLGVQAVLDILCGLIAAFLFSMAAPALGSLGQRVLFTAVLGIFAAVAVQAPEWNWYGFPAISFITGLADLAARGVLAGLVFAKMIR